MDRETQKKLIRDDYDIVEDWVRAGSTPSRLVQLIEDTFGLLIDYKGGYIIVNNGTSSNQTEVTVQFVLNHKIVEAERIHYDDRQLFVRVVDDKRLRKVMIRGIRAIQYNGQFIDLTKQLI